MLVEEHRSSVEDDPGACRQNMIVDVVIDDKTS